MRVAATVEGIGKRNVHFSSASDRWPTPLEVYSALDKEFGFNFDPCPLDGTENGLATLFVDWSKKRVFCNPPYGRGMDKWLLRGMEAEVAVFLIPARTDTKWFHEIVLPNAKELRFLKGRLKFGDALNRAPFPSMVVIFGSAYELPHIAPTEYDPHAAVTLQEAE